MRGRRFFLGSGMSWTSILIVTNVALFFVYLFALLFVDEGVLVSWIALTPSVVLGGRGLWTLVTSMFMHGGFFHLFANMFSLFFVGNFVERLVGKRRFLRVYFLSGLFGGLFYILFSVLFGTTSVPAVGASGAIFGLLGVLAVLTPYSRISLIAGPLILIVAEVVLIPFLPVEMASGFELVVNILFLVMIFAMFSYDSTFRRLAVPVDLPMWVLPVVAIVPLSVIGLFVDLPIGNSAHFGGLVVGLGYGVWLRWKYPRKTRMIAKYFSR